MLAQMKCFPVPHAIEESSQHRTSNRGTNDHQEDAYSIVGLWVHGLMEKALHRCVSVKHMSFKKRSF